MDNRTYGYARVSSREQNEDRQIEALTKFGVPEQNIIIDDGTQDFLIKENRALHAALDKHGIKHSYSERPGRHSWDYWVKSLTMHLDFFAKHF